MGRRKSRSGPGSGAVSAKRFGFNTDDSTNYVQSALTAGAGAAEIPYMAGRPWHIQPLDIPSNTNLYLKDGGYLKAATSGYGAVENNLLRAWLKSNIGVYGMGGILEMRREVLTPTADGPHCLNFRGSTNVTLYGLNCRNGSGDGVYVGPDTSGPRVPCEDVLIAQCVCDNNRRQGISITAGRRITVRDCILKNSKGSSPQSGLDIEPPASSDPAVSILIQNVQSDNNTGAGLVVALNELTIASEPVSILFTGCTVSGTSAQGLYCNTPAPSDEGPGGTIEFRDCTIRAGTIYGLSVRYDVMSKYTWKFTRCTWIDTASSGTQNPLNFQVHNVGTPHASGGVVFEDCKVIDRIKNRSPILLDTFDEVAPVGPDIADPNLKITGNIDVVSPYLPLGPYDAGITGLTVTVVPA